MNDAFFKYMLGKEVNLSFTLDFLNRLLQEELGREIADLRFAQTEVSPESNGMKVSPCSSSRRSVSTYWRLSGPERPAPYNRVSRRCLAAGRDARTQFMRGSRGREPQRGRIRSAGRDALRPDSQGNYQNASDSSQLHR